MSMVREFKAFVMRGNVIDMAVGIVIGTAFTAIVKSLVNDVIMPPIGLATAGVRFAQLKWELKAGGANGKGEVAVHYGAFVNTIVTFLIIAVVVFLVVKGINRMQRKKEEQPAAPAAPSEDVVLLREIRDLLKAENS